MKKEIPRLLKCASIVYAFDSGTVFDVVPAFKYFRKHICNFNPDNLNIRWILIVDDEFLSALKAKLLCFKFGLKPSQIIKCCRYKKKISKFESIKEILTNIHDHKKILTYISPDKVKKVIYINNDMKMDDMINQAVNRVSYNIIAMNVMDFWQNKYSNML